MRFQRNWLQRHGIVKSKTAKTRDELLDLAQRNYYGARDTTYNLWNDNQIKNWLVSRGLIKPDAQKKREEYVGVLPSSQSLGSWIITDLGASSRLLDLMSNNYYKLRDQAYQSWDDNMLRVSSQPWPFNLVSPPLSKLATRHPQS